jgi:hypothetical protein
MTPVTTTTAIPCGEDTISFGFMNVCGPTAWARAAEGVFTYLNITAADRRLALLCLWKMHGQHAIFAFAPHLFRYDIVRQVCFSSRKGIVWPVDPADDPYIYVLSPEGLMRRT